jgi:hypothetical protein
MSSANHKKSSFVLFAGSSHHSHIHGRIRAMCAIITRSTVEQKQLAQ